MSPEKTSVSSGRLSGLFDNRTASIALAAAAAILVVLYFVDMLPEHLAGMLLGLAVVFIACSYLWRSLGEAARSGRDRMLGMVLTGATLVLALAPTYTTLSPGEPAVIGELAAEGDAITLPDDVAGPIRVLVHGTVGGQGTASVVFKLEGTSEPLEGRIERTQSTVRAGRRGHATVSHTYDSVFLTASVAPDTHVLKLKELQGSLTGPLKVRVYKSYWPLQMGLIISGVVLLLVALVAGRLGIGSEAALAAGFALAFGTFVYRFATPDAPVRPEVGAALIGALVGPSIGGTFAWLARKAVPPVSGGPKKA